MITKFRIKSYKSKKYFWVLIHPTLEDFRLSAKEYYKKMGGRYIYQSEYGLFHPYEKWVIKDKKSRKTNNIGIIRLIKNKLYPRCVYHEVLHAAMWQYRLNHRKKGDFGEYIDKKEEELAHSYDQLLSNAVSQLYKLKLWK